MPPPKLRYTIIRFMKCWIEGRSPNGPRPDAFSGERQVAIAAIIRRYFRQWLQHHRPR
ncbi:hypothetical protein [Rhizobium sp. R339]|uniref:hypothetical protein n=1 Tax=Rhizobium sp. R339 TaxID=1764273 RepID=UPI00167CED7E|nr:hypothetical protein [Rhizobium sp. R339]